MVKLGSSVEAGQIKIVKMAVHRPFGKEAKNVARERKVIWQLKGKGTRFLT